ncbi:Protein of unknown function [Bacillus mycoides]|nr:Protein of unknown function [Bacillus mycoides]
MKYFNGVQAVLKVLDKLTMYY